jgi:ACS family hexuronate transporter-like MFS transporter
VGAILAPFIVGAIVSIDGRNWQIPFLFTGVLSFIWVILWWRTYHKPEVHPKLSKEELSYITSDSAEETTDKIAWIKLLPKRETWAFTLTKLTDAVWWFYLFWGAKFLAVQFDVNIKNIALPFFLLYAMADVGSLIGGYTSDSLIRRGWTINRSRKLTMLVCAILILPVCYVPVTESKWLAVFLIGLGAAGHQAWSVNGYTLASDVFPKKATASVIGFGGMFGALAGILADLALGSVLDKAGNSGYFWAFVIAGSSYIIIIGFVHLLMPHMTPLNDKLEYIKE